MKRHLSILSLILICQLTTAQDVQRFAERSTIGTARYVGMGGAMTAIGGDPSAAIDNPAGLGLYRRSELSVSIDETIDNTQQAGSKDSDQRTRFSAPQITAIWAWGKANKQRGLVFNNFMFSYHRLANFNRDIVVQGGGMGMVSTICNITNDMGGVSEEYLANKPWDNVEIAWLSILGYEAYLINPIGNSQWEPAIQFTDGTLSISETGISDQYTLSWAGNINNQWYIGVGLNIPTINYTKHTSLREVNNQNASAELKSMFHVSGVGVSGSFGLIYRPVQALRIGASLQTPTVMQLSRQTTGDMYSTVAGQKYEILTPESGVMDIKIASPLRTSVSVAGQIFDKGLVAIQYDCAHSKEMEDIHTLRFGAEAQAYRGLFINAGYIYESSFTTEDPMWLLGYNEIRTDIDYRYTAATQYASAGIGYRSDVVIAQLAYQYGWQTLHQYASEEQELPFYVNTHTHRIVATLAWRF